MNDEITAPNIMKFQPPRRLFQGWHMKGDPMTRSSTLSQRAVCFAAIFATLGMIQSPSFAETYMAGQAGVTLPQR